MCGMTGLVAGPTDFEVWSIGPFTQPDEEEGGNCVKVLNQGH